MISQCNFFHIWLSTNITSNNRLEWLLKMCFTRECLVDDTLLQMWHLCEFPSRCVSAWLFITFLLTDSFPHTLHFHFFSFFSIICSIWRSSLMVAFITRLTNSVSTNAESVLEVVWNGVFQIPPPPLTPHPPLTNSFYPWRILLG